MSWWRREGGVLVLEVHVQPGTKRTQVVGLHGGRLKVRLAARAVEGAANAALVEFLAGAFAVAKREVRILAGETSRQKRVSVAGATRPPETLLDG